MSVEVFFDTNILVYATIADDARSSTATAQLALGGLISVQVLNEFVSVSRRKLKRSWAHIHADLLDFEKVVGEPKPISMSTHRLALALAEFDGFSFYDALIVASALETGCTILLTEDMQDGRVIDGRLTIRNPFSPASPP